MNVDKPFSCDVCGKSFKLKHHVTSHKRIHTGEKPFSCDICGKSFKEKTHVTTHKRVHTGEKPFSCDTCEKTFSRKDYLTTHIKIHTGEKSYVCDICEKTFYNSSHLANHKRIHTGEKPYSCVICQKSYSQSSQLSQHNKTPAHLNRRESVNADSSSYLNTFVDCSETIKVEDIKEEIKEEERVEQHLDCSGELENSRQSSLSFVSQQEGDITVTESISETTEVDLSNTCVPVLNESVQDSRVSLSSPYKLNITPPSLEQQNSIIHLQVDSADYFLIVHRKDGTAPKEGDFIQYFGITPESFLNCTIPDKLLMIADISKGLAIDLKILCDANKYPSTVLSRFLYKLLSPSARPLDTSCLSKQNSDRLASDLMKLQFRAKKFRAKYSVLPKYLHELLLEKYHPFNN